MSGGVRFDVYLQSVGMAMRAAEDADNLPECDRLVSVLGDAVNDYRFKVERERARREQAATVQGKGEEAGETAASDRADRVHSDAER